MAEMRSPSGRPVAAEAGKPKREVGVTSACRATATRPSTLTCVQCGVGGGVGWEHIG